VFWGTLFFFLTVLAVKATCGPRVQQRGKGGRALDLASVLPGSPQTVALLSWGIAALRWARLHGRPGLRAPRSITRRP